MAINELPGKTTNIVLIQKASEIIDFINFKLTLPKFFVFVNLSYI